MQIGWYSHACVALGQHGCVCQGTPFFTPLTDVALPSRRLCCRPGLALSFMFEMCSENHRYFSHKIRKQRRQLKQWPVVFHSGRYYSAGLSYLYFYHITSQMYLYYLQYLWRKEENLGKGRFNLTRWTMGLDSPAPVPATLFSPRNFPALNERWADEARCSAGVGTEIILDAAVLQPWQWTVHNWCLQGWALEQTYLSWALCTLLRV